MSEILGESFLWVKAAHVVSVIAWMAGLLYLPRLFVYHCDAEKGSSQSETFKVMERRLLRGIMNPAMMATWIFGLLLMVDLEAWSEPWFHAKVLFVLLLTHIHHLYGRWRKDFERDANKRSPRFYRVMNEVPAVALVIIVILVIVKPF